MQRVCRRVLRNEHDVEDVFQATFLVLARRASGIPWRASVAGWLGAVAHRLALGARSDLIRQNRRETAMTALADGRSARNGVPRPELAEKFHSLADPFAEVERREVGCLVHDELLRLPEKYRSPVVLCYLEGRTHEEAAHQLGCPAGSMSRRLKRAQAILRRRLIHRGLSFVVALFAVAAAVVYTWNMCYRPCPNATAVQTAMASLEPLTDGCGGIQTAIEMIDRAESDNERGRILALATHAIRVAGEIEGYEPRKQPEQWREYLSEMRLSAALLKQSASENARSPMLSAARRLNASCLGCHEAFCQSAGDPADGVPPLLPGADISRHAMSNRSVSSFIFDETSVLPAEGFDPQINSEMDVALLSLR